MSEVTTPLTIDVVDATGKKNGTADLPAEIFDVQVNIPLIHQVVVAQQAAARQGTASVKTRAQVRGGGAKPWRQKGTGRARQGSRRAPQWTGGGVVHGPTPRDYSQRTPKKMVAAALRGALSDRARDGKVHVLSEIITGDAPSTRAALSAIRAVAESVRVLVVLHRDEDLEWVSLRNAVEVHTLAVDQLNAYDVLCSDDVIFSSAAFAALVAGPVVGKGATAVATESEAAADDDAAAVASLADVAAEDSSEPTDAEVTDESATVVDHGPESYRGDTPPAGFDVKGNEDSMKFHTPESPWYDRTVAEVWFSSADAAQAAGFANVQGDHGSDEDADDDAEEATK